MDDMRGGVWVFENKHEGKSSEEEGWVSSLILCGFGSPRSFKLTSVQRGLRAPFEHDSISVRPGKVCRFGLAHEVDACFWCPSYPIRLDCAFDGRSSRRSAMNECPMHKVAHGEDAMRPSLRSQYPQRLYRSTLMSVVMQRRFFSISALLLHHFLLFLNTP
jgi:hypothetical protein